MSPRKVWARLAGGARAVAAAGGLVLATGQEILRAGRMLREAERARGLYATLFPPVTRAGLAQQYAALAHRLGQEVNAEREELRRQKSREVEFRFAVRALLADPEAPSIMIGPDATELRQLAERLRQGTPLSRYRALLRLTNTLERSEKWAGMQGNIGELVVWAASHTRALLGVEPCDGGHGDDSWSGPCLDPECFQRCRLCGVACHHGPAICPVEQGAASQAIRALGDPLPAQQDAMDRVAAGQKRLLILGLTGSGKSHALALCIAAALDGGAQRVAVLVPNLRGCGVVNILARALGNPSRRGFSLGWDDAGILIHGASSVDDVAQLEGLEADFWVVDNSEHCDLEAAVRRQRSGRIVIAARSRVPQICQGWEQAVLTVGDNQHLSAEAKQLIALMCPAGDTDKPEAPKN